LDGIVKVDVLGNVTRRTDFKFCMRAYASDDNERLLNVDFMRNFAEWIEQCSRNRVFPAMGGAMGCSFEVPDANGELTAVSEDGIYATYEMTVRFIYKANTDHTGEKG